MAMEVQKSIVKMRIPVPCPLCEGRMFGVAYVMKLHIIEESSIQVCGECGFCQLADDFKKTLLTV